MDLTVGHIVWARRNKNDIYWPGKITIISNNTNNSWSTESTYNYQQQFNYLVQFFVANQSIWTTDILPYRQYKDSMTNDSFIHYGLHPTLKQDFLNAVNQADSASSNEMYINNHELTSIGMITGQQQEQRNVLPAIEDITDNDFLLTPSPMVTSYTGPYNPSYEQTLAPSSNLILQSLDTYPTNSNKTNQMLTTNNDWYVQQGLLVESITPPLPSQNDNQLEYITPSDDFQNTYSVIIITTKSYSNSSLISYLFNCLSNFFCHSVIYIDDLTNYQHPTTASSNIYYLICLDHFHLPIQQILDSTILNNLNPHMNYLFLIINSPSNDLIKHFYSRIMDKRMILVVQYQSTFDNEALLLCSGNRRTYEMNRTIILKYLCSNVKYIESNNDEEEQLYSSYCISSIIQSANILNNYVNEQIHETLNEKFDSNFFDNNQNVINELFPQLSINKSSNENNLLNVIHNSNEDLLKNPSKQITIMNDLFESGAIKTHIPPPICEYYTQNILQKK